MHITKDLRLRENRIDIKDINNPSDVVNNKEGWTLQVQTQVIFSSFFNV